MSEITPEHTEIENRYIKAACYDFFTRRHWADYYSNSRPSWKVLKKFGETGSAGAQNDYYISGEFNGETPSYMRYLADVMSGKTDATIDDIYQNCPQDVANALLQDAVMFQDRQVRQQIGELQLGVGETFEWIEESPRKGKKYTILEIDPWVHGRPWDGAIVKSDQFQSLVETADLISSKCRREVQEKQTEET